MSAPVCFSGIASINPRGMSFVASKLFWWIASPGNVLLGGAGSAPVAWPSCSGRLAAGGRAAWSRSPRCSVLAVTFLPLGSWLLLPLEDRFAPPTLPAKVDGIIVLGGFDQPGAVGRPASAILTDSAERLLAFSNWRGATRMPSWCSPAAALRYSTTAPGKPTSPGTCSPPSGSTSHGGVRARVAQHLRNAIFSKQLVAPQPGETWVMITSAYHMPRAVGCFRVQGWPVLAISGRLRHRAGGDPPSLSLLAGLDGVQWALREWIGLVFYYVAGRTDRLFPGPASGS